VPDDTARIARAAFRRGNPYVLLRDQFGAVFDDAGFADLYPALGQPAYTPWRLALVTLMQFREGLSDRQAAEAVRGRIDVLCEFRGRLLQHKATERLLERVLGVARDGGLLKARGRQRTDSTHVLAAIRTLNRLELVGETLRAALNAIAVAAPDWLRGIAPLDWHERYDRRVEDMRLPESGPKRDAYFVQVGADGFLLLDMLDGAGAPPDAAALPAVAVLRRVWARHFERDEDKDGGAGGGVQLRAVQGRGPGDRLESPYDTEARFRTKSDMTWTGYMAHVTETCDAGQPRLVVHADTTAANVHEATRTEPIHTALANKGLAPAEHLVDAAYISAGHLVDARERFGIELIGPPREDMSWQTRTEDAFGIADFAINWEHQRVQCPEGHMSARWGEYADKTRERYIRVGFSPGDCDVCPSKARCTKTEGRGRQLTLHTRAEHEALLAARARLEDKAGRELYAQRQGVESAIAQAACAFGLRQARYRGLAKTHLQNVATAAAINLDRLGAWLAKRPLAPTRLSRFAALAI
jgi:transposase